MKGNAAVSTVFVVDDDTGVRYGLSALLEQEGMHVESFETAEAFLAACRPMPRSCAIVDIQMPGLDGMQLQSELLRRGMPLPIIFLTGHGDIPTSVRAIKAGAVDFLSKPVSGAVLLGSVQAALEECERLNLLAQQHNAASARIAGLTNRERDVLLLAVEGLNNKDIARRLGISFRTVEVYKAGVMHKTGAATLVDLVRLVEESRAGSQPRPSSG